MPKLFMVTSGVMFLLMGTAGCAGAGEPAAVPKARAVQTNQIIVKFRESDFDPSRPDYLQILARETGVTLIYVRPMSGGAHVMRIDGSIDIENFRRVVEALARRIEVEYAEPDHRMFTMPRN